MRSRDQPGPLTLVQDRGRFGFQKLGVSVGGAIDTDALGIGNRLVGNNADAAVLEVLLGGLEIEIAYPAVFALTGANTGATLDGVPLSTNVSYTAHAGSRLSLGRESDVGLSKACARSSALSTLASQRATATRRSSDGSRRLERSSARFGSVNNC